MKRMGWLDVAPVDVTLLWVRLYLHSAAVVLIMLAIVSRFQDLHLGRSSSVVFVILIGE